jgi:hypothetical protein
MSANYALVYPLKYEIGLDGLPLANSNRDTFISARAGVNLFKVVGFQTIINAQPSVVTHDVVFSLSDSAGSFSSPTVLATHTITSSDVVGAIQYTAISTDVLETPQALRIRINAGNTDATARYTIFVFVSPIHC